MQPAATTTKTKHYLKVRAELTMNDYTGQDLPMIIHKSQSYCDQRMAGNMPFTMEDCYKFLDFFKIDHSELPDYFPAGGLDR